MRSNGSWDDGYLAATFHQTLALWSKNKAIAARTSAGNDVVRSIIRNWLGW
jgi:hypothetical protein